MTNIVGHLYPCSYGLQLTGKNCRLKNQKFYIPKCQCYTANSWTQPCSNSHLGGASNRLPDPTDGVWAECRPVDIDEPSGKQKQPKL